MQPCTLPRSSRCSRESPWPGSALQKLHGPLTRGTVDRAGRSLPTRVWLPGAGGQIPMMPGGQTWAPTSQTMHLPPVPSQHRAGPPATSTASRGFLSGQSGNAELTPDSRSAAALTRALLHLPELQLPPLEKGTVTPQVGQTVVRGLELCRSVNSFHLPSGKI